MHLLDAAHHEAHSLFQRQPETGHARIGDGDVAIPPLLDEQWNDAAPAAHHVAVARAAQPRAAFAGVGVGLHKHFLGAQLGGAI